VNWPELTRLPGCDIEEYLGLTSAISSPQFWGSILTPLSAEHLKILTPKDSATPASTALVAERISRANGAFCTLATQTILLGLYAGSNNLEQLFNF